jgi:hypothetical protein
MDKVRAEILKLDSPKKTAARIVIDAPAQQIFDLIADPRCHPLFDGSGTLQGIFQDQNACTWAQSSGWL